MLHCFTAPLLVRVVCHRLLIGNIVIRGMPSLCGSSGYGGVVDVAGGAEGTSITSTLIQLSHY